MLTTLTEGTKYLVRGTIYKSRDLFKKVETKM